MSKKRKATVEGYSVFDGEVSIYEPHRPDSTRYEKLEWWGVEALKMAEEEGYQRGIEEMKEKNRQAFKLLGIE